MKEAVITDTLGVFRETTLVTDDVAGVFPIYGHPELPQVEGEEDAPQGSEVDSEEATPEPVLTGYQIAMPVTPGLYVPKWDFEAEAWVEALTPEEIEELKKPQQPVSVYERVSQLEAENASLKASAARQNEDFQNYMEFSMQEQAALKEQQARMNADFQELIESIAT
ncbi:hypothetical protein [Paenibacillus sp. GbtcB18]|uniref:hypothetical protein n=1 Tax=Paenibacillus sp. GbtcB18 TaxID=2824763 RepID=UPI001C30B3EB|nr:hypothetical protein [Paenibacillus sp. GbtcB18]